MLYSIHCFYLSVWILESLRQGLHVVASWDYHRGAKIRDSVRGNPGRFSLCKQIERIDTYRGTKEDTLRNDLWVDNLYGRHQAVCYQQKRQLSTLEDRC
jgi:hypothetical protein